jgi:hypothetical protein
MGHRLTDGQTPFEFFREQVVHAIERQKLAVSPRTQHYLVDLLERCVRADALALAGDQGGADMPLAMLYLEALRSARHERPRRLRATGDRALFVSGFLADSVLGKVGDLRYYRTLGCDAYARLSRDHRDRLGGAAEVFADLAARFGELADVLCEISETSRMTTSRDVVRLYERWEQTRSRRAARLLAEHGITPGTTPSQGTVH